MILTAEKFGKMIKEVKVNIPVRHDNFKKEFMIANERRKEKVFFN